MIGSGNAFEPFLVKNGLDVLTVEGTADTRYSIPNFHVSAHHRPSTAGAGVAVRSATPQFVCHGDADR